MKKLLLFVIILIMPIIVSGKEITVKLEKCMDGDTAKFIINNSIITARFLAIDTPETIKKGVEVEAYGKEASDFTCDKLTNANNITIEYDKNSEKLDKYDRHLVWVFVDNELLQEDIIKNGLGKIKYVYGDYKYLDNLKEVENIARIKKIGVWSLQDNYSYFKYIVGIILSVILILAAIFIPKNYSKINKCIKRIKKELK
ncbi:MAG: thermonuclease family protein [Bacilli bacterium]